MKVFVTHSENKEKNNQKLYIFTVNTSKKTEIFRQSNKKRFYTM